MEMIRAYYSKNRRKSILVIVLLALPMFSLWSEGNGDGLSREPSPCELDIAFTAESGAPFSGTIESMLKHTSAAEPYQGYLRVLYTIENLSQQTISFKWESMVSKKRELVEVSFRTGYPPSEVESWYAYAKDDQELEIDLDAVIHLDQSSHSGPHEAPAYVEIDRRVCGGGVEIGDTQRLVGADVLYDPITDGLVVTIWPDDRLNYDGNNVYRAAVVRGVFDTNEVSVRQALDMSRLVHSETLGEDLLVLPSRGRYYLPMSWSSDARIAVPVVLFGPEGVVVSTDITVDRIERPPADDNSFPVMPVGVTEEAPTLANRVARGDLPSLEMRLPEDPLVVAMQDDDDVERYGGILRRAWMSGDWYSVASLTSQRLMRFTPDVSEVVPNIASKLDISHDDTTFTVHLRKGVRWSDGEMMSADDFVWWFENILSKDVVEPPSWLTNAGELTMERVDPYTVRFRFAERYDLFPEFLARLHGYGVIQPSHYLKQFHPEFTDRQVVNRTVNTEGFEDWTQLLRASVGFKRILVPDVPSLNAWVAATDAFADPFVMERNPYFWQVDVDGRQLPYIDTVIFHRVDDQEILNLKAIAGEIDFQFHGLNPDNLAVFQEYEDHGGYRILHYGIRGDRPVVGVVNGVLRNVPKHAIYHDIASSPGNFIPEQFYYSE